MFIQFGYSISLPLGGDKTPNHHEIDGNRGVFFSKTPVLRFKTMHFPTFAKANYRPNRLWGGFASLGLGDFEKLKSYGYTAGFDTRKLTYRLV